MSNNSFKPSPLRGLGAKPALLGRAGLTQVLGLMPALRKLAVVYSIVVGLAAGWAFYVDARLLHSAREHLLPDIVLMLVTLPASLSVSTMYEAWPAFFSKPFTQIAWVTLCGIEQVGVLFLVAGLMRRRNRREA